MSWRKLFGILYSSKHLRGTLPPAGSGDLRWFLRLARRELARRQNNLILVAIFCGLLGNTSNFTKTGEASPQARAFLQLVLSSNVLENWLTTMSIEALLKRFDASAHPFTADAYRQILLERPHAHTLQVKLVSPGKVQAADANYWWHNSNWEYVYADGRLQQLSGIQGFSQASCLWGSLKASYLYCIGHSGNF